MASATSSQPLKDAIPASILKQPVDIESLKTFQQQMLQLLEPTNTTKDEEHIKNILSDVLKKIYYDGKHALNTKERIDLAIFADTSTDSTVEALIEAKKIGSKEMPKVDTEGNLSINCKALHELMLYFLRERTSGNTSIKHLIITDTVQWYVFDAKVFEKHIYENKPLRKKFTEIDDGRASGNKTSVFYEVADKFVADLPENTLEHVFLNLRDYETDLREFIFQDPKPADPEVLAAYEQQAERLRSLYWFFSPEHLLKKPPKNDSNSLNKPFYDELLHIIGLTEVKDGGKKVITRCPEGERHYASLLESTISVLQSQGELRRQDVAQHYGDNEDEQLFGIALELVVTWLNRVLFLKLLEAQLISYHDSDPHKDQYAFLNSRRIPDTQTLNTLFFNVLAMPQSERQTPFREMFASVPYLNSSLFEATALERDMFTIASIAGGYPLPLYKRTVFKDAQGKRLEGERPTLAYLLQFLDAYKFSSEGSEPVSQDKKMLINASVLGLIFEKLNGYQDGSFFTPGFITMYMCRESLRRAVVQKFNDEAGWTCQTLIDVYNNIRDKAAANAIINSLKICDPAVGSGHFLVSALNELIAIKSELGILQAKDGRVLRDYSITVENDELIVKDPNGGFFAYNPNNDESQRVQETLFREKQTLIENCLFGVDINPNSVKICRLRLWIELLKHAYYKNNAQGKPRELETLPNIDINIKTGNSLISRFGLDANIGTLLKSADWNIQSYQNAVQTYRNAVSKGEKRQMEALIQSIKDNVKEEIGNQDPDVRRLQKIKADLSQGQLIESKAEQDNRAKLQKEAAVLAEKIEIRKHNPIYQNAFEWRFEFPEVLDDEGDFVGFDVIIGNPPYIRHEEIKDLKPFFKQDYQTFHSSADLLVYFVELGWRILSTGSTFSYIVSNKWMRASYGKSLRDFLANKTALVTLIDFGELPVFQNASTFPMILSFDKRPVNKQSFLYAPIKELGAESLERDIATLGATLDNEAIGDDSWTLTSKQESNLISKVKLLSKPLADLADTSVYRGLITGLNQAFVVNQKIKNKLIIKSENSTQIIRPFLKGDDVRKWQANFQERYLIVIPSGWTHDKSGESDESNAWKWLCENYPAIAKHLSGFETAARKRYDKGEFWWELRSCDYYDKFEKPKIIYPDIAKESRFAFDESGMYAANTTYFIPSDSLYLLGVLNSKVIFFYYKKIAAVLGDANKGGRLRWFTQDVLKLPIRTIDFSNPTDKQHHDDMVAKVEKMLELHQQKAAGKDVDTDIRTLDAEIDALVYGLYDLTEDEIAIVEGTA